MKVPGIIEQQELFVKLRAYLLIGDKQNLLKETGELLAPGWVFDVEDRWTISGVSEGIQKRIPGIAVYYCSQPMSNNECVWSCL